MASTATHQAAASSTESGEQTPKAPITFTTLPTDVRLLIYDCVFYSTTLEAERDPTPPYPRAPSPAETAGRIEYEYGCAGPLYVTPTLPTKLNLVCKLLNSEILHSWHSKVTYSFPDTMAFLDVLSQWSEEKLAGARHIYVVATPLPLRPAKDEDVAYDFVTHFLRDVLVVLPGLQLDCLTVENYWIDEDGAWCDLAANEATLGEVFSLVRSEGWRELRYVSGPLPFFASQLEELENAVVHMKSERSEDRFTYEVNGTRPRLSGSKIYSQSGVSNVDTPDQEAEVAAWEAEHAGDDSALPTGFAVRVRAKRGAADYAQKGEGAANGEILKSLLRQMTWLELRANGRYVYSMDDPGALL